MLKFWPNFFRSAAKKRVYFDHAATTPVHREVLKAMLPYFSQVYGNPSAVHQEGVAGKSALEGVRTFLARTLRVRASDVIFTSGGTESINLGILGLVAAARAAGTQPGDIEIISTAIEHPAVSETLARLAAEGVLIKTVPVDDSGLIQLTDFTELLSPKTLLVVTAYVNSEIGVVQEVKRISRAIRLHNQATGSQTRFLLDAAQAPLWLPIQLDALGVDMIALDAGKCCGPKGSGALAYVHGVSLQPTLYGGPQERGLRAGTENVPLIVGLGKAIELAQATYIDRAERVAGLRDYMLAALKRELPEAILNGSASQRVANNINISLPGIDTEFAVITLDAAGIACSTKSACSGADGGGSVVVRTITGDEALARSTIRFTLGETTTKSEIDYTIATLAAHVAKMRVFQKSLT